MSSAEVPNEAAQKRFVAKLDAFRSSLDGDEQRMLDALVAGARQAHDQGDVQVYWFTPVDGVGTQPYGVTSNVWSSYGAPGFQTNTPFSGGTG
ncbi:MAG TPA: hypothetical protein VII06_12795 [Chloroflexota bacterium]|jgi:hypothetical protein